MSKNNEGITRPADGCKRKISQTWKKDHQTATPAMLQDKKNLFLQHCM